MAAGGQQQIALDKMPVINLTQRAPVAGPSQSTSNGGGDDAGEVEVPGMNYRKVVPRPDDEPSVFCVLSGNSVSGYTELCGWSLMQPLKFFNISQTTQFHSMTDGRGDIVPEAEELSKKCITLREMSDLIGGPSPVVHCPVFVHVVAKRKVDIIPIRNRILIIPLVVIADKSGYCVLCSINEGLATIYNTVEVGDLLLISRCLPQLPKRTYHRGLFSEDMFLNMELKLQFHSVRTHYIYRFTPLKLSKFQFPEALFLDASSTIKLPSTLEKEFKKGTPAKKPTYYVAPNSEQYYDLVGVVTYVGRVERFSNMEDVTLDTIENGKIVGAKSHRRFLLCRWIYLADLQTDGKGFPVKLYVNNATWDQQGDLVPGAILTLTHCVTVECGFMGRVTATSHYSQIYVQGNIEKYYMLHPVGFREVTGEIMGRANYVEILGRRDLVWMVGGSHGGRILNGERFKEYWGENRGRGWNRLGDRPMRRRESRRLYVEGEVLRVIEVEEEGVLRVGRCGGRYQVEKDRKGEYEKIENFWGYRQHGNTSWFAWKRRLPGVDGGVLRGQKCREICRRVVGGWRGFLGVLGLPSEYGEEGGVGGGGWREDEVPGVGKLERVDGPPYFRMDLVNVEERIWYGVMWRRGGGEGMEEMRRRVEEVKGRKVVGIVEVYCTEVDSPLEVNLLDFVVNEG